MTFAGFRLLVAIVMAFFGIGAFGVGAADTSVPTIPSSLQGVWVVKSFYRTSNVWGISLEQAQRLLGSKLRYSANALTACDQKIAIHKVVEQSVSAEEFVVGRNVVHFTDVGVHAPSIRKIKINDNAGGNCFGTYALPGEYVYLKSRNELLVEFEGVFFRALRKTK